MISGEIAGYPLRIAIECKNYAQRIGVEKIDEFKGKLEDVGIPQQCGIFVTVRGFTKNALRRAATIGIRPLLAWHAHQLVRRRRLDFSMLSALSLADIEGTDLSAAWEPIGSIHPVAHNPDWPYHTEVDEDQPRQRKRT